VWIVRGLVFLLALVALAVFFAQNSAEVVDLTILHWEYLAIPLYLVVAGSFLVGVAVSVVVGGIREIRLRNRMRILGRSIKERDREIADLRNLPLQDLDSAVEEH
jgi:uncharacterized integral membrane protein